MEAAGAAGLAVHGRTAAQSYSGLADWDLIASVAAAVSIPVWGNGDCNEPQERHRPHARDRRRRHPRRPRRASQPVDLRAGRRPGGRPRAVRVRWPPAAASCWTTSTCCWPARQPCTRWRRTNDGWSTSCAHCAATTRRASRRSAPLRCRQPRSVYSLRRRSATTLGIPSSARRARGRAHRGRPAACCSRSVCGVAGSTTTTRSRPRLLGPVERLVRSRQQIARRVTGNAETPIDVTGPSSMRKNTQPLDGLLDRRSCVRERRFRRMERELLSPVATDDIAFSHGATCKCSPG